MTAPTKRLIDGKNCGYLPCSAPSPYPLDETLPLYYGRWSPPIAWARVDAKFLEDLKRMRWTIRIASTTSSCPIPLTYISRGKRWNILKVITLLRTESGFDLIRNATSKILDPIKTAAHTKSLLDHLNLLPYITHKSNEPHDYRIPTIKITDQGGPSKINETFRDDRLLPSFLKLHQDNPK